MLAADRITTRNRVAFTQMAAARQADAAYANYLLSPANRAAYNAALAGIRRPSSRDLASIEQAVAAGTAAASLPVSPAGWQQLTGTLLRDEFNGGVAIADGILAADHQASHSAWVKVGVTGGIVLLGLLITILVSTLIGRGIIRGLRGLERSARTLAEDQLPDVVARLRRGEDVDVATEAPPLRTGSRREAGPGSWAGTRSAGWARPSTRSGRPPSGPRWTRPACGAASTTCSAAWPGAASRCCTASWPCSTRWNGGPTTPRPSMTCSASTTSPRACAATPKAWSSWPARHPAGPGAARSGWWT